MADTKTRSPEFLIDFDAESKRRAGQGPAWLRDRRKAYIGRFEAIGLPTTTDEDWRNTNLAPVRQARFRPAEGDPGTSLPEIASLHDDLGGCRLVFVDGKLATGRSRLDALPADAWVGSLNEALDRFPDRVATALERRDPEQATAFVALNGSLFADGAFVWIPDGVGVDAPIQIVHVADGRGEPPAVHGRTVIELGSGSRATVVESYAGEGGYLRNHVTDVQVGDAAHLAHVILQDESPESYHLSNVVSRQGRDSRYAAWHLDLGGRLVRHDVTAVHAGEGGDCRLDGLYLTDRDQHVDFHTVLDHTRPHCDSREVFKGVLAGGSRAVFHGRIIVRQEAQRTDAKQSNPNLLLSSRALAHTRPQLEIYADDVKCTHGATIGRLDREAIEYLRARAIPEAEARNLLIEAFAGEILERVPVEPLRRELERAYRERLAGIEVD